MKTPREKGLEYEERLAALLGARIQPGSGNQWFAKLDLDVAEILFSLKHTSKASLSVTRNILSEVIHHATKIGSKGAIPAVAVDIAGEDFVLLRANDFAKLMEEDAKFVPQSTASRKRHRASIPEALRHAMEQDA